jgi:hypothetical protein
MNASPPSVSAETAQRLGESRKAQVQTSREVYAKALIDAMCMGEIVNTTAPPGTVGI